MKYTVEINRPTYRNTVPFNSLFGANYFAREVNNNTVDVESINVVNNLTGEILTIYEDGELTYKAEE